MSAYLDKSQGVTFVYSNIYNLYLKAKNAKLDDAFSINKQSGTSNIIKNDAAVEKYQPRSFTLPMGVQEAEAKAVNLKSMSSFKKNIASLKEARAKLHFLLKEIESESKKR